LLYARDANIESMNETMVQVWVFFEETRFTELSEPCIWFIWSEWVRSSVREDTAGLHGQIFCNPNMCVLWGVWCLSILLMSGN